MNGFNLSDIQDAKLGTTQLSSIYLGSTKLWPTGPDYSQEYFTIESLVDNNTISMDNSWAGGTSNTPSSRIAFTFEYSTDKTNWTTVRVTRPSGNGSAISQSFTTLNTGDKLYIRGNQYTAGKYYATNSTQYLCHNMLRCTGYFNIYGNIMSLRYNDNFVNQTSLSGDSCFYRLFYNNANIRNASNLILPATTLVEQCYYQMFYNCNLLTTAPTILPATTLTTQCYQSMFNLCSSLIASPILPATTLVSSCYDSMFKNCTSLNYVKALFTTKPSAIYTYDWLNNVASTGTFIKNSAATWTTTGKNAVPTGWTVITVSS